MNFKQKFYDITNLIQVEFDRNAEKYGDKLQCRRGCSKCCSQIFNITLLDAYVLQEHIRSLPIQRQAELKSKAEEYLIRKKSMQVPLEKVDTGGLPCPALGTEGECTIYEGRPVICRRFGIPIFDYKNPGNVYACELNFKSGDEIVDDLLVPNQTAIGMKWDELKEEFNSQNEKSGKGTTIAEAISNYTKSP